MSQTDLKRISLRIRLPYTSEDEFMEKYGQNVARGGIFIATRALKSEGTHLSFELILADGTRLMRGDGVVQKIQVDEGGGRAGMTVRFARLDARSKALVDRIVARRRGVLVAQAPDVVAAQPEPIPIAAHTDVLAPEQKARRRSLLESVSDKPAASSSVDTDVILGIDLGSTNSRVAVVENDKVRLVPLTSDGKGCAMPSVVALDEKDRFLIGTRAKAQIFVDPKNTIVGAKRLLGRRAQSRRSAELSKRVAYSVVSDPEGDAGVELRGQVHRLTEISAKLLSELKNKAQEFLGRPAARAVLCVPAYFNDHQRAALLHAAKLAGLKAVRILNEPTAVALAFGYGRGLARKRVLVYDLGGGTFDASVVELTGDDLEVVTTAGENFLGGMDFDQRLAGALSQKLEAKHGDNVNPSPVMLQRIRDAAEQAKIALSELETTNVHVPMVAMQSDGSPVDLKEEVTRTELEKLTHDLVDRTVEITRALLDAGGLKPQSIDEVILVGGQSRTPLVRRRIEEALGRPCRADVDPDSAVALGAAIFGQSISRAERGKTAITLSEVLSAPIGIGLKGGAMHRVLEQNTRLPAQKTYSLPVSGGEALGIAVFQGNSAVAEENEYLGSVHVTSEHPGELSLRFEVSANGTLGLFATTPGGHREEAVMTTTDASDEIRAALLASGPMPGEPDDSQRGLFQGIKKLFGRTR